MTPPLKWKRVQQIKNDQKKTYFKIRSVQVNITLGLLKVFLHRNLLTLSVFSCANSKLKQDTKNAFCGTKKERLSVLILW